MLTLHIGRDDQGRRTPSPWFCEMSGKGIHLLMQTDVEISDLVELLPHLTQECPFQTLGICAGGNLIVKPICALYNDKCYEKDTVKVIWGPGCYGKKNLPEYCDMMIKQYNQRIYEIMQSGPHYDEVKVDALEKEKLRYRRAKLGELSQLTHEDLFTKKLRPELQPIQDVCTERGIEVAKE